MYDNTELLGLLIQNGVSIETVNTKHGCRPLHSAVVVKNTKAGRFLIEAGAEVNSTDFTGKTPLHAAAAQGNVDAIQLLIEHGAELEAIDETGATPLIIATIWCHTGAF